MQVEGARQRSFFMNKTLWPHPVLDWLTTPVTLARAGFYFTPTPDEPESDSVTCYLCNKSLDGWTRTDHPETEHDAHSPECPLTLIRQEATSMKAKEQARLATFGSWWPHSSRGRKKFKGTALCMAKAGFVYCPSEESSDMVQCYQCGLALDGWEPADDPIQEHLKRSPDCEAIAHQTKSNARKPTSKRDRSLTRESVSSQFSNAPSLASSTRSRRRNKRVSEESHLSDSSMATDITELSVSTVCTDTTHTNKRNRRGAAKIKEKEKGQKAETETQAETQPKLRRGRSRQQTSVTEEQSLHKEEEEASSNPLEKAKGRGRKAKTAKASQVETVTEISQIEEAVAISTVKNVESESKQPLPLVEEISAKEHLVVETPIKPSETYLKQEPEKEANDSNMTALSQEISKTPIASVGNKENNGGVSVDSTSTAVCDVVLFPHGLPFDLNDLDPNCTVEDVLRKLHQAEIQRLIQRTEETLQRHREYMQAQVNQFRSSIDII